MIFKCDSALHAPQFKPTEIGQQMECSSYSCLQVPIATNLNIISLLSSKSVNHFKKFNHKNLILYNIFTHTNLSTLASFSPARGGQIPQLWNFQDATKDCGYASPGNPETP